MAKKAKEKSLDLFENNENMKKVKKNKKVTTKNKGKVTKNNKSKEQSTKDEKFNFDEEIIIGLKKIEEEKIEEPKKQKNSKKTLNNKQSKNEKSKDKVKKESNEFVNIKPKNKKQATKKLTKEQEIAIQKRKAVFKLVKWTSLLLIIIGAIIYTLLSPIFNVKTISVIGNSKVSIDEIISLSKIELENNMFKYNKNEVINNIKENGYIEAVKISRKIPDTIEITVEERKASFMIQFANAYAFINNQGYILEITAEKEELPIVTGIETKQEELQEGNRLCEEDLQKIGDILKIMKAAQSNGLHTLITEINIKDSDNYILTMKKLKKTVYLGDTSNLSPKMSWIITFNQQEGNTEGEIVLNMNLNDEKNKPYFRKKI